MDHLLRVLAFIALGALMFVLLVLPMTLLGDQPPHDNTKKPPTITKKKLKRLSIAGLCGVSLAIFGLIGSYILSILPYAH